jgi:SAM-dependent methyltransferase
MPAEFREYAENVRLKELFAKLEAVEPEVLAKTAEYFTTREAAKRDSLVVSYFGEEGISRITDAVASRLVSSPKLPRKPSILDVGAGSGFFTARIADKIRITLPEARFYAMDITPAMLILLAEKKAGITPFIGIAENIKGSVKEAQRHFKIPSKFDAEFSTLMLHHSANPEKVFRSLKTVLKKSGKAIIVDLCEHEFEEFRTEMGDVHLGFKSEDIRKMAREHFSRVEVEKIPGIRCKSSGRSAEIFVASMRNSP